MNGPDPPHWAINSCFGASRSVWVHLAMFHYYTKLGAKRVELVQLMHKFVQWSRFGIFRNECTQPTPLDPKLMYCCVSQCLGAFWIVSLLHEAWCKTGWTGAINAKVFAMKSHQNFSQRTHLIHPIETLNSCFGASHSIWVHLAMFRYYTKLGAKRVELVQLMQKFVPWSRIRIFRNKRTQSTPLDHSCLRVSRSVWVYLAIFRYSTKLSAKRVEPVQLMHKFVPWNRIGIFAMNGPNPPRWALNSCFGASRSVWVHLAMFHYYTKLVAKWVELVQLMHKFVPWSRFGIFRNECTWPTPLDLKLMFWRVS